MPSPSSFTAFVILQAITPSSFAAFALVNIIIWPGFAVAYWYYYQREEEDLIEAIQGASAGSTESQD